jgi:hypothetical protein
MEKNAHRPQRISPDQVDSAVDAALARVKQATELSESELESVSGALSGPTTTGYVPPSL